MAASDTAPPRLLLVGDDGWLSTVSAALDSPRTSVASDIGEARSRLDNVPVDCVISALSPPDGSAIDLLRSIREDRPHLPVVIYARSGDEECASAAIGAGATDYLPADSTSPAELRDRAARATEIGRTREERDRRARQFEALFAGSLSATWVLDSTGRVERVNDAARAFAPDADAIGDPLWERPWIALEGRPRLREAVERAGGGDSRSLTLACAGDERAPDTVELSVEPIEGSDSLVVTALDVSERVELAEELTRSEQLHRVTLNNMTDTVLVTDDEGRFTYVCPNVHFIFGYTVSEIRELGTIEELLGPELFDPAELREKGVLTNIECTATDRAGEKHTLLVNAKRVSIQGGTTLYSCRDVTTRKQRERALSTLHGTARELLYAEGRGEVAGFVATDAADVLDTPEIGCYLFDAEANALRPAATTDAFAAGRAVEPIRPGEGPVWRAFIDGEVVVDGERLAVPLGDHGVLAAAFEDGFDALAEELADLLAATAEAALDRIEREAALRERDRELRERNDDLSRLNRINDVIRGIDGALVGAETCEGIERAVTERLASDDRYRFAWIGSPDDDGLAPGAWAGEGREYLDRVDPAGDEPAVRAARSDEAVAVDNVAADFREAPWRAAALEYGYQSVLSVPLAHEGLFYGVLSVYADRPDAFDEMTRAVFLELADTIAAALTAVKQRNALLRETVTELVYEVDSTDAPLLALAQAADCEITLEGGVRRVEDGVLAFVAVEGAPLEAVREAADDVAAIEAARPIAEREDGGVLRLRLASPFVATRLADRGATLRAFRASAEDATARLIVDVSNPTDVRAVDGAITELYPEATLLSQREQARSGPEDRSNLLDRLTDRQREAVRTAYHSGFFESPRNCSGEAVADALGISPSAFYQLNRAAQRALFGSLFDGSFTVEA
ncbi:bacterio-opsin activator domain-containing protein [Halalkalicoccus jeotgali]|uniref:PAS/PAC sensor protein n=1 Tax=Halalkalicoccus jeotgali (strain DSM 18796 / CECT 7217 / JCM 14584 / KCTC 4019 / B3) TaxID=795797 RepID=D8J3W4_HALJB|nr:bacterio-opsin activator domain-containing protein [Halalkalicoccus jeotgali]ADJ13455.1 putative PAS/PAC sensor protein [Halalkalicoccus jeotgali B3]ELY33070.1 putative PAS/PAC sensor protein [Halalkalicoccus jeotgali B3]